MSPTQKDIDPQSAPVEPTTKESPVMAAAKPGPKSQAKPAGVQRIRLVIASDNTQEGKSDVSASDGQGGQYLIKRDEEVEVPIGVYNVLRCANTEVYQTDANDSVTGSRSVPRFNIRVVG